MICIHTIKGAYKSTRGRQHHRTKWAMGTSRHFAVGEICVAHKHGNMLNLICNQENAN